MSLKVETLRWRDNALELIDQRSLPLDFAYVRCTSAAQTTAAIRDMVVRGAPAIGCAAAYGLAVEAARLQQLAADDLLVRMQDAAELLTASRPTAVNLSWAVARMRRCLDAAAAGAPASLAAALLTEAHAIRDEDIAANRALGAHGAALIADGARVLTHCNAGALATAGHGTALGVIRSAVAAGKRVSVFVDETRPFLQGARLTAWELLEDGIPATLIADVAAGHLMSRGEVDAVIVGTDRVAANGDVANKIGTYPLAVLAQRHGIPFYVACPLSTLDLALASGAGIPIEERPAAEVTGFREVRWAPERIAVRNPAFDVTPAALVSALITERGVIDRPDTARIRAFAA
ncbi:MAG: S-methyl-5-thioribose-1-phosphate isomerase [Betaproteobacteria bacterium]|nr:S-methyl-5-thioribose-1-phosphate isomerase [Betaproteobacteria bacterium]